MTDTPNLLRIAEDVRACTCHPDEAPVPCQKKYAFSECRAAAREWECTCDGDAGLDTNEHDARCPLASMISAPQRGGVDGDR